MNPTRKNLECPFVWRITDEMIQNYDLSDECDEDYSEGIFKIMIFITKAYIYSKRGMHAKAIEIIENLKKFLLNNVDGYYEREHISIDMIKHICEATKYYVCERMDVKAMQSDRMYAAITCTSMLQRRHDISTLQGCMSICYSVFYGTAVDAAIQHARRATRIEPRAAIWHFVLGKNLRRKRRDTLRQSRPRKDEKWAFLKAERLNRSFAKLENLGEVKDEYAVYVAQMYQENKQHGKSLKKYEEVRSRMEKLTETDTKNGKLKNVFVLMRLAMGYLKLKHLDKVKRCMDEVDKLESNPNPMIEFYKGCYWEMKQKYEEAAYYYERSAIRSKLLHVYFRAIDCRLMLNPMLDPLWELKNLLRIYKDDRTNSQSILLSMGMVFLKYGDLSRAMGFFMQAIKLNPTGSRLRDCWTLNDGSTYNAYELALFIKDQEEIDERRLLHVVKEKVYENEDERWLLRPEDLRGLITFCEIVTVRKPGVSTRITLFHDRNFEPALVNQIRLNENENGELSTIDWYYQDGDYEYRRISNARPGSVNLDERERSCNQDSNDQNGQFVNDGNENENDRIHSVAKIADNPTDNACNNQSSQNVCETVNGFHEERSDRNVPHYHYRINFGPEKVTIAMWK